MPFRTHDSNHTRILYDHEWLQSPEPLFQADNQHNRTQSGPIERGTALFFDFHGAPLVLKHYHRGGLMGRLVRDTYTLLPGGCPRMLAEFQLLDRLNQRGLPVPVPVAARCQRTGWLTYRGDLITRRIPGAHTLYQQLCHGPLDAAQWQGIGRTVARFHAAGVDHADLNATNIMLDQHNCPWLIDFDKSRLRGDGRWKAANLRRLKRSLEKLRRQTPDMHYTNADWSALLRGYHG